MEDSRDELTEMDIAADVELMVDECRPWSSLFLENAGWAPISLEVVALNEESGKGKQAKKEPTHALKLESAKCF